LTEQFKYKSFHFRVMDTSSTRAVGKFINRWWLGILFTALYGTAGFVATLIIGVGITGDVGDLGAGIENFWSLQGFGQILWWSVSTLIIAGIAIVIVKYKKFLSPFKNEEDKTDIPKHISIVVAILLGAIISFFLWVANIILSVLGSDLSSSDIRVLIESIQEGNITLFFLFMIFSLVVGVIVVGVASRTGKLEKVADTLGINKF